MTRDRFKIHNYFVNSLSDVEFFFFFFLNKNVEKIFFESQTVCSLQGDIEQYKKALTDAGCDLSPLNYIKQWK